MITQTDCHIVLNGLQLRGEILRYKGGQIGIQFFHGAEPYGRPTCNIPEKRIRPDQCWVRTYDEHLGFLDAMIAAKVVQETPFFTMSGEIRCNVLVELPDVDPDDTGGLLAVQEARRP